MGLCLKKCITVIFLIWCCCKVNAQHAIDTVIHFQIGGLRQAVSIKGSDRAMPLLLYLHGGPGNAVAHYADRFTGKLQNHFVVVHWDQRNSGRTLELNVDTTAHLGAQIFREDTYAIVDNLLKLFNKEKLYVAGHSWGTYLGFQLVKNHPHQVYAYFAICPMIDQLESERIALRLMNDKAVRNKNKTALAELAEISVPFESGFQLYLHRKWLLNYMGVKANISKQQVNAWASMWLNIFNEASTDVLFETLPQVECPVYFFVGRKDIQTNSEIAEKYYQRLSAPKKNLYWFERSAHALPTTEPEKLQQLIISLKEDL